MVREPAASVLPGRGPPAWLLVAAAIAAAAIGGMGARDMVSGPAAWAQVGRSNGCDVYENRFTARVRVECPGEGGRHA